MTLSKLSLRNARRQAGDYLIYFVTIVMVAALLYAFNGLVFSQEIQELSSGMAQLPMMIVMVSIVVVCVIGWLVSYTTKFMFTRRSREFGTYVLIGLTGRQVARLFFLENIAVGAVALGGGVLLGGFLYQILRAIIFALFGTPYHFTICFSPGAVVLTCVYFTGIYLLAQAKSNRRIRKMKIYDLIYFDRRNEGEVIRTSTLRKRVFVLSIVLGVAGTVLIMLRDLTLGLIGAGCIIVFLYGFFLSFASGVPAFFDRKPSRKYRGRNLLVFRTLTAKLGTMGIAMATISMLFTATLIAEGTGMVFSSLFWGRAIQNSCFDLFLGISSTRQDAQAYLDYIGEHIPVEADLQYQVYRGDDNRVSEYLIEKEALLPYYDEDLVLRYSDYAALRRMLGYPEAALEPGSCLVHCMPYLEKAVKKYDRPVVVDGVELTLAGVYVENLCQYGWDGNGGNFILVVPDELAEAQSVSHRIYAAMTTQPVTKEQFAALRAIRNGPDRVDYDTLKARSEEEEEAASMTAMTVFPLYFLALVLAMTAATILTIQQLAEMGRYRKQFLLLQKLGMDRGEMAGTLRTQFAIYAAQPVLPPVLISVSFILNLGSLVEPGIMMGANRPGTLAAVALGIFFLIYGIYVMMAYRMLRRNVLPL